VDGGDHVDHQGGDSFSSRSVQCLCRRVRCSRAWGRTGGHRTTSPICALGVDRPDRPRATQKLLSSGTTRRGEAPVALAPLTAGLFVSAMCRSASARMGAFVGHGLGTPYRKSPDRGRPGLRSFPTSPEVSLDAPMLTHAGDHGKAALCGHRFNDACPNPLRLPALWRAHPDS
jgi:hypothetical protein